MRTFEGNFQSIHKNKYEKNLSRDALSCEHSLLLLCYVTTLFFAFDTCTQICGPRSKALETLSSPQTETFLHSLLSALISGLHFRRKRKTAMANAPPSIDMSFLELGPIRPVPISMTPKRGRYRSLSATRRPIITTTAPEVVTPPASARLYPDPRSPWFSESSQSSEALSIARVSPLFPDVPLSASLTEVELYPSKSCNKRDGSVERRSKRNSNRVDWNEDGSGMVSILAENESVLQKAGRNAGDAVVYFENEALATPHKEQERKTMTMWRSFLGVALGWIAIVAVGIMMFLMGRYSRMPVC